MGCPEHEAHYYTCSAALAVMIPVYFHLPTVNHKEKCFENTLPETSFVGYCVECSEISGLLFTSRLLHYCYGLSCVPLKVHKLSPNPEYLKM